MSEEDESLWATIVARRAARRAALLAPDLPDRPLARRVRAVAQILSDEGYQARVEGIKGGFRIVEENCAIRDVAERFEQLCEGEFDFLRQAFPDAHVERVSHRVAGDQHT